MKKIKNKKCGVCSRYNCICVEQRIRRFIPAFFQRLYTGKVIGGGIHESVQNETEAS